MQMTERSFTSWDGTELFYRAWLPEQLPTRAILLFHRGHEHSGRWQETIDQLHGVDVAYFAWDQRGHGRSPGDRGDAPNVAALIKDADVFARHVTGVYRIPLENTAVIASSLGAVIAATWVHDFGPPICGMVLAAPAFRVRLYVPFAIAGMRVMRKFWPGCKIKSYVKAKMFTHDPAQAAKYDADPLIFRQISVNLLLDLYDTSKRILDDAAAIGVPMLLLAAGSDWVVDLDAQKKFFRHLGSRIKQMEIFPRSYHSLFHEANNHKVFERTRAFLQELIGRPANSSCLLESDKGGFTRTEYDLLRAPGSARWALVQAGLKIFGRLSNGISLGLRTGFDSGLTLDYIYEKKVRGTTPLGRIIDYFYLNAIGWRGIRVRRHNLERSLRLAIDQLQRSGQSIHILDIASGPGRYVLETLQSLGSDIAATATLRDYQEANLAAARQLVERYGLHNVVIEHGDAFDGKDIAAITPRPTIAIVSGLYELFPENGPVLQSLRGIAAAMDEGGLLIYTCQPWHPQVEFIARALTNREGNPWIMRRRAQAEMDALAHAAGFEKMEQDIDSWGIFTVSVARRAGR